MTTTGYLQASDRPDGISSIVLLFILLIGLIIVFSLVGYLVSSAVERGSLPKTASAWLQAFAVLLGGATVVMYMLGAGSLIFMEEPDMQSACRTAGGATHHDQVDGYDGRYFPPRFLCRLRGGGSYTAQVPGYVNPSLIVLSSLTVACAGASWITRPKAAADNTPHVKAI
ncbi:hypothetical protein ACFWBX_27295 [Streptomyces sp. NPDC059991]|uniref:hypothetical protein n=1 Tax=Streptomyces sp. NPDC059991 TaxID=3347028 RepID=UPI00369960A3